MPTDRLVLTAVHDGVLVVTLNDPARRNPVSTLVREQLIAALAAAAADDAVRALVLTGADGAFSSGGDLSAMPPATREDSDERMSRIRTLVQLVAGSAKPMIAAVEGPAAGISVGLMAACDIVIMAEGAKALFPFTRLDDMSVGSVCAGSAGGRGLVLLKSIVVGRVRNASHALLSGPGVLRGVPVP